MESGDWLPLSTITGCTDRLKSSEMSLYLPRLAPATVIVAVYGGMGASVFGVLVGFATMVAGRPTQLTSMDGSSLALMVSLTSERTQPGTRIELPSPMERNSVYVGSATVFSSETLWVQGSAEPVTVSVPPRMARRCVNRTDG